MEKKRNAVREAELVRSVLRRHKDMAARREQWEGTWRELAEYMLPRKSSSFGGAGRGKAGDERVFDSTPSHGLELLASALGGLLTNPALPWFDIRPRDRAKAERKGVRRFLQQCRERMLDVFGSEGAGFQNHVHELYLDVALLGTGVMYVEADPRTTVRFSTRPLSEVSVAESWRGEVDTVMRRYEVTARQAVQEWGANCSEKVRRMAEDKPEAKVEILHAVYPRKDRDPFGGSSADFPYASLYVEAGGRNLLEESGYMEMPYMVPRWAKVSGEVYGRGPGLTALSGVRVLNAMARTSLMAAEKMSDPPLMVPDDGFLGPVRSNPGGLSYYRAGTTDRIEALPVHVDLSAAEEMMRQRRESVRRIFMAEQLQEDAVALTATEALIRQAEKLRVLGPVLGRMQAEFLTPLVRRVFRIMVRSGAMPEFPAGLCPSDIRVEYVSPVVRAQKQYEAQAMVQTMDYLQPLVASGRQDVLDNFDADRVARHAADLFGIPADYVLPEEKVVDQRQARQAVTENGMRAERTRSLTERLETVSRIAKTLADARTDSPSALTELVRLALGHERIYGAGSLLLQVAGLLGLDVDQVLASADCAAANPASNEDGTLEGNEDGNEESKKKGNEESNGERDEDTVCNTAKTRMPSWDRQRAGQNKANAENRASARKTDSADTHTHEQGAAR